MRQFLIPTLALGLSLAGCSSDDNKSSTNRTPSDHVSTGGDHDTATDNDGTGDQDNNAPEGWNCSPAYYNDGSDCDCGCGVLDPDCATGCAEPGCEATDCEYCYNANGEDIGCPAPEGWTCGDATWNDYACDCGCGIEDPSCYGTSCTTPGCRENACDICHDSANTLSCAPDAWTCTEENWTDGVCDCGCGVADADCADGNCTTAGCQADVCDLCHNGENLVVCKAGWACAADTWGGLFCDCGCGIADKSCEGGCVEASCLANGCHVCHDGAGDEMSCAPAGWTCSESFYGDGGCDCGCGIADVDCTTGGCTTPGCTEANCGYCWGGSNNGDCPQG